jgi:hypothetical protein
MDRGSEMTSKQIGHIDNNCSTQLFPRFSGIRDSDGTVRDVHWRIECHDILIDNRYVVLGRIPGHRSDFYFGSKMDVERAIEALEKHGIKSGNDIMHSDLKEFIRICCSALLW